MPSKKKLKPSFNVPEELQAAPQAGWVYRSDSGTPAESKPSSAAKGATKATAPAKEVVSAPAKPAAPAPAATVSAAPAAKAANTTAKKPAESKQSSSKSDDGILGLMAKTIYSGFETIGNAALLTTRIIAVPISMGMRLIGLKSK